MKKRSQIFLNFILVVAVIVFLNMVSMRWFARLDLTEDRIYTLSEASRNLVRNLDDKLLVKAYYTKELPPPHNNNRQYLKDQLDEYRAYAGGNFQYEFIDPSGSAELEQEAQRYGIPPVQVQVLREDKFQSDKAYMGVVLLYGDKQERLQVIQSTSNLEYEISSAVKKLTTKQLKKVGFLKGQGEPELEQYKRLQEILGRQYEITPVDLSSGAPVPADITALVIAAPTTAFKTWEKYLIDQYLMKGGKLALFLNRVNISLQSQMGRPAELGLDDLLESYGLRINEDLVRDASCAYVTVSQQAGFMVIQNQVPFYYLPRASSFDEESPVVQGLSSVVLYFASSIDTSLARAKGLKTQVLLKSSARSGRQQGVFKVDPTEPVTQEMFAEQGIPLVVTVEGSFVSLFAQKGIGADTTMPAGFDSSGKILSGTALSKVALIGDGDFLQDQYSGGNPDNFLLASNIIDWLADDIGLAQIRARDSGQRPLEEVDEATKMMVKTVNLAVPPLLVIGVGLIRWRWRVAVRKRLEMRNA